MICFSYNLYRQTPEQVATLLSKMSLKSTVKNNDKLEVEIPPTRHDVIHNCDIYEDLAIAYGYNEIEKTMPQMSTIAAEVNLRERIYGNFQIYFSV